MRRPKCPVGDRHRARRSLVLPASEEAVKASGLKQGVRVTAADISGL